MQPRLSRPFLERAYVELKWREYARNPALFLEECVFIPSQESDSGRTRFLLYDHQRGDLETFLGNKFVVVLKGRQIGLSTIVGGLSLWRAIFRPGSVILWVSNNQDNANKAINSLNVMWQFLPEWVKARAPVLEKSQAGLKEWKFADGLTSRIRAFAGTATAGASETASIVILDEFALVDGHLQDDLLRTTIPTTDAGGQLWVISTARGGHNRFAKTFRKAAKGASNFVSIFHPWMVSHFVNRKARLMKDCQTCGGSGLVKVEQEDGRKKQGYCETCVDTTILQGKAKEFEERPWLIHAEYPSTPEEAFRESGNPVFRDLPDEDELETHWIRGFMMWGGEDGQTPTFVPEPSGALRIRGDIVAAGSPDSWRPYVLFDDPAEGVGGDYNAAQVLTWDDDALPTRVAWWHDNQTDPVDVAFQMNLLGRYFHNAILAVENTGGFGGSTIAELNVHHHYPRLYSYTPTDSRRRARGNKIGFAMSWTKRPQIIDRLMEYMTADKRVGGIDPLLRQELAAFVRTEKGRMEGDVGTHDDLVLSLGGALWILVEDTKSTSRPSSEEVSPDVRIKLKATMAKRDRAIADQAAAADRWERDLERRAVTGKRIKARREARMRVQRAR